MIPGKPAAPKARPRAAGANPAVCSQYLKGLADADRLRILECLLEGPKPVGELAKAAGKPIANISHHLVVMRGCGLVTSKRSGRFIIYALSPEIRVDGEGGGAPALNFGCCRFELMSGK